MRYSILNNDLDTEFFKYDNGKLEYQIFTSENYETTNMEFSAYVPCKLTENSSIYYT